MDALEAADPPEPSRSPGGSVGRAVGNATDIGVAYGWAALRAGVRAGVGLGRATTDLVVTVVDRSPVGTVAAATADALEPTADHIRRNRRQAGTETQAAAEQLVGQLVDGIVQRIDIDGIVQGVDIDRIVQRVDIAAIVETIDIDEIVERLDINAIVDEIDIDSIVTNTEIGSLIVQSTGGVATEALDVVRSQGVSLDDVVTRITDGLLRRRAGARPAAPERLTTGVAELGVGEVGSEGAGSAGDAPASPVETP